MARRKPIPATARNCALVALVTIITALALSRRAAAQDGGGMPASAGVPLAGPATTGLIQLQGIPVSPQTPPEGSVAAGAANQFERTGSIGTLPHVFARQWSVTREVPPESLISQSYLRTVERTARQMTLKEAIYIALRNNPSIKSVELNPVASSEAVRQTNGAFDPNLTSQADVSKSVLPATSVLQTGGASAYSQKSYD